MSFVVQFRALLWKNWVLKRRQPMTSLAEIVLPALLLLVLVFAYKVCPIVTRPGVAQQDPLSFVFREESPSAWPPLNSSSLNSSQWREIFGQDWNEELVAGLEAFTRGSTFDNVSTALGGNLTVDQVTSLSTYLDLYHQESFLSRRLSRQLRKFLTSPQSLEQPMVVPSFDVYIEAIEPHGKVAFIDPHNTSIVPEMIAYFNVTNKHFAEYYMGTYRDEDVFLQSKSDDLWALVVIQEIVPTTQTFRYTIRMNSSLLPPTQRTVKPFPKGFENDFGKYYVSGFLTFQRMLDSFFARAVQINTGGRMTPFLGALCSTTVPQSLQKYFPNTSLGEEEITAVRRLSLIPPINQTRVVNTPELYYDNPCQEEAFVFCRGFVSTIAELSCLQNAMTLNQSKVSYRCRQFVEAVQGPCQAAVNMCVRVNVPMADLSKCLYNLPLMQLGSACQRTTFFNIVSLGRRFTEDVCKSDALEICGRYDESFYTHRCLVRQSALVRDIACRTTLEATGFLTFDFFSWLNSWLSSYLPGYCQDDIYHFCADAPLYSPLLCLHKHFDRLSPQCRSSVYGTIGSIVGGTALNVTLVKPAEQACRTLQATSFFQDDAFIGAPMPVPPYRENQFYTYAGSLIGLTITLCFMFPMSIAIRSIVLEKEIGLQDLMVSMGLDRRALFCSWVASSTMTMTLTAFFASIVTKFGFMEQISFSLVFVVLTLFGWSLVALVMLFAVLFTKARMAAAMAPVGLFVFLLPKFVLSQDASFEEMIAASFASPSAAAFTLDQLLSASRLGLDIGWGFLVTDGEYSVLLGMSFCVIDAVIYLLLAALLDRVFVFYAQQGGDPVVVTKIVMRKLYRKTFSVLGYQTLHEAVDTDYTEMDEQPVGKGEEASEGNPHGAQSKVILSQLTKRFHQSSTKDVLAVDAVSVCLFENCVNVLLGHNGAGKSTLVSMLTGSLTPTAGYCRVYGKDVEHVRHEVGICPQQNVLLDLLTCHEHMLLFASIKGLTGAQREAQAQQLVNSVILHDKRDVIAGALSGGMKRHLCTAIAFVGNPKLVILDESTAGVDPVARRHLWELIRSNAKNRCILLTTHFLDEAELLSDHVIVMNEGRIRCSGTPMYLKNHFGTGYTLTFCILPHCDVLALTQTVQMTVAEATLTSHAGNEVSYALPKESSPQFPALFARLDQSHLHDLRVASYGISCAKLADVLLKVIATPKEVGIGHHSSLSEDDDIVGTPEERLARLTGRRLLMAQMRALFVKRALCSWRDKATLLFHVLLPIVAIVLCMQLQLTYYLRQPPPLLLTPAIFGGGALEEVTSSGAQCPPNALYIPDVGGSLTAMGGVLLNQFYAHGTTNRYGGVMENATYMQLFRSSSVKPVPAPGTPIPTAGTMAPVMPDTAAPMPDTVFTDFDISLWTTSNCGGASGNVRLTNNQGITLIDDLHCITGCPSLNRVDTSGLKNVTRIGSHFLKGCKNLTFINTQGLSNVTNIGDGFLSGTPLKSINTQGLSKVTSIGNDFFRGCTSLKFIDTQGLSNVTNIGEYFLSSTLITSINTQFLLKVTSIGDYFLRGCTSLTSFDTQSLSKVTRIGNFFLFGTSVTFIDTQGLSSVTNIGDCFLSDTRLTSINTQGLSKVTSIGDAFLFDTSVTFIDTQGLSNVTNIGEGFLSGTPLMSINTQGLSKVTSIGDAFLASTKLTFFDAQDLSSVTSIGDSFLSSSSLTSINTQGLSKVTSIGKYFLSACVSLRRVSLEGLSANLRSIGEGCLLGSAGVQQLVVPFLPFPRCDNGPNVTITGTPRIENVTGTAIFHNTSTYHGLPVYLNKYTVCALRRVAGRENLRIEVSSAPMPRSETQEPYHDAVMILVSVVFILVPFTFIPANFVSFVVKEKESGARHVQLVSGVTPFVYWVTLFLWDMLIYVIITFLTLSVFQIYGRSELVGTWYTYGASASLFFFYGLSSTAMCCFLSIFFQKHTTAQSMLMMVNFTGGFLLVIAANIIDILPDTEGNMSVKSWNRSLMRVYRLMPSFALGEGLCQMSSLHFVKFLKGHEASVWEYDVLGRSILCMAIMTPIFLTATICLEQSWGRLTAKVTGWHRRKILKKLVGSNALQAMLDEDVLLEAARSEDAEVSDKIVVRNLGYSYVHPPHAAVHNLSFGVHSGEIFALIGPNGAGKTSTLAVLSGEATKTVGEVTICGLNISKSHNEVRRRLGWCPQRDGIMDYMTPRDTLRMFARTKGLLDGITMERHITSLLDSLGLTQYEHYLAKNLSGGNKRKLCVATCLVSFPEIVFMDEPSSGMDPVSRRCLWDAIRLASHEGSCMVLTTQHFDEVESLAHRMGVLHHGQLACVGSLQHLKSRFGSGYEFLARVPGGREKELQKYLTQCIRGTMLIESHNDMLRFGVPVGAGGSIADIFDIMERVVVPMFSLVEYSVTQATLEQIFVKVTQTSERAQVPGFSTLGQVDLNINSDE